MTDDSLDARLRAVERAVTDGESSVVDLSDAAAVHDRLDALEGELAELTERVDALDATVQSLHGYVGEIEHVNERVERRADAARAAVERLENQGVGGPQQRTGGHLPAREPASPDVQSGDARGGSTGSTSGNEESASAVETAQADSDDESLLDRVRESL